MQLLAYLGKSIVDNTEIDAIKKIYAIKVLRIYKVNYTEPKGIGVLRLYL